METLWPLLLTAGIASAIVGAIQAIGHALRVRSDAAKIAAETHAKREDTDHALVAALVARVEAAEKRNEALEARMVALEKERDAMRDELAECERRSDAMRIEIRELYQVIQSVRPGGGQ
jgi:hypothetical protein